MKMAASVTWLCLILCLSVAGSSPSVSGVARPSVTYGGRDRTSLEKDIAAVFNKVAHGSTPAPPNTTTAPPTTRRPYPTRPPRTTIPTPLQILTQIPDAPDIFIRPRFKPPLPPEYTNPFADKPILRGSQSEGSSGASNRRQLTPPPPPIRPLPEMERIPIRPPDLAPPDRKKPVNTPSGPRADPTSGTDVHNETDEVHVPLLQSPAVTRILSENTGRTDEERRNTSSRVLLDQVNKDSMIDIHKASTLPPADPSQEIPDVVTDPPHALPVPEWPPHIGGVAWNIIVYVLASLFALLAVYSLFISPLRVSDSILNKFLYFSLHLFVFIIGVFRGAFLFHGAFNVGRSVSRLLDSVLLDMVFPLITSAFAIVLYGLMRTTKVQLCLRVLSPMTIILYIIINIALFAGLEWTADTFSLTTIIVAALRSATTLCGILLIAVFSIVYSTLFRGAHRLQNDVLRANFAKVGALPRRPQLTLAARLLLCSAFLILVLCVVQMYALLGFHQYEPPRPWHWWVCQLISRIVEFIVCCLLLLVAWLRRAGLPSKFTLCCVSNGDIDKSVEDLFPAICSKNNAIHNYSMHTGKTVYDYPRHVGMPVVGEVTTSTTIVATTPVNNRTIMKCGTMPAKRHNNKLNNKNPNHFKSSSVLFAEEGVVRFRTTEDSEQPMNTTMNDRSLTCHEALTAFNVSEDSRLDRTKNRSGSLGDLREDSKYYRGTTGRRGQQRTRGDYNSRHHHLHQRHLAQDSPDGSSMSCPSSSDLSESDLTSAGYERVRTNRNTERKHYRTHH